MNTTTFTSEVSGFLPVDKTVGLSSHAVVSRARKALNMRRIGHTGTLDPQASGLLVLCLGAATKLSRFVLTSEKTYQATIRLGQRSSTLDSEGVVESVDDIAQPKFSVAEIQDSTQKFVGNILQTPPMHSAIKVKGQTLYHLARRGEELELTPRRVVIHSIDINDWNSPFLKLSVHCGSGVYIRSLARDIGEDLGCGAYLSALRRTSIGKFSISHSFPLENLIAENRPRILDSIIDYSKAIELPSIVVADAFAPRVRDGVTPLLSNIAKLPHRFAAGDEVSLVDSTGKLLAVGISQAASDELVGPEDRQFYSYLRVI